MQLPKFPVITVIDGSQPWPCGIPIFMKHCTRRELVFQVDPKK